MHRRRGFDYRYVTGAQKSQRELFFLCGFSNAQHCCSAGPKKHSQIGANDFCLCLGWRSMINRNEDSAWIMESRDEQCRKLFGWFWHERNNVFCRRQLILLLSQNVLLGKKK